LSILSSRSSRSSRLPRLSRIETVLERIEETFRRLKMSGLPVGSWDSWLSKW
jgi:hypothetical protein